ncbi:hypothetical protein ACTXT7_012289 [Hymenolepis weldensis]
MIKVPTGLLESFLLEILRNVMKSFAHFEAIKCIISWWKAGEYQELSLGLETRQHRFYLRRSFYEDWTLVIDNVQEVDAGFYACQINTDTLLEKIFLLNVTDEYRSLFPTSLSRCKERYWHIPKDDGRLTDNLRE